jgi:hypothetical protein
MGIAPTALEGPMPIPGGQTISIIDVNIEGFAERIDSLNSLRSIPWDTHKAHVRIDIVNA